MAIHQNRALIFCVVVFVVALAAPVVADDAPVLSNLELMTRLTSDVTTALMDSVPANIDVGSVILVPKEVGEQYTFTDNVIARVLTASGRKVFQGGVTTTPSDSVRSTFRLEYQVIHFELSYPKIYRPFLIGGKKVKRSADVRLLFKLLDSDDQSVVWIGEATRSHDDKFSYSDLPEVEAGSFAFTTPEQSPRRWGKVLEPVVVSGIIIGLIYLFFANQE